ncbi:MAG: class I SAM-dependent methyltransferase [Planctomycetota bacterium]|nr:class I SAM-dependent methyltransferase [Planctomycetota bacterium]
MYRTRIVILLVLVGVAGGSVSRGAAGASPAVGKPKRAPDSVFVPTPDDVLAKMLEVAGVTKDDTVYDPGCGDGRIVIAAAKKYGCRGVGIELSPKLVKEAQALARRNHVENLVRIVEEDIYVVDMSEATVVTLYLLPGMNVKLIPQLQKLKPGARIVAHDYGFQNRIKPDKVITMTSKEDDVEHHIFLWKTPLQVEPASGERSP